MDGNTAYVEQYWPQLTRWAEYLKEKGFDPENQLCTDDFAGHLAHNVNLSVKAIWPWAPTRSCARCAARRTRPPSTDAWPRSSPSSGCKMADDGDHYRLAFDKPGTWSQKYNLVWDRFLGLNLFPAEVARKEMAYYKTKQNRYGLPLDNRADVHQARLGALDGDAGRRRGPTSTP